MARPKKTAAVPTIVEVWFLEDHTVDAVDGESFEAGGCYLMSPASANHHVRRGRASLTPPVKADDERDDNKDSDSGD